MILYRKPDGEFEQRVASRSIDVLIRAGLILATAALCFKVFAPFPPLMVWALIVAGSPYPPWQSVTGKLGEPAEAFGDAAREILGIVLIVAPVAVLISSLRDSVPQWIGDVQKNALEMPAPRDFTPTSRRDRPSAQLDERNPYERGAKGVQPIACLACSGRRERRRRRARRQKGTP